MLDENSISYYKSDLVKKLALFLFSNDEPRSREMADI